MTKTFVLNGTQSFMHARLISIALCIPGMLCLCKARQGGESSMLTRKRLHGLKCLACKAVA